jgi:tetratricopeptide (TPR) repeat protein
LKAESVDALAQLGFVVGERGRDAEAEGILRRAVALDARHFYANYDLGRLLVRGRRYDEALAVLTGAARIRSGDAGVHYQLFIVYTRTNKKTDADRELQLFKRLDEERKARRVSGGEEQIEDTLPKAKEGEPE